MVDTPADRGQPHDEAEAEDAAREAHLDLTGERLEPRETPRELDLSKTEAPVEGGVLGPVIGDPIERSREDARRRLAYILVGILGFTVAFSLFAFFLILMGASGTGTTRTTVDDLVTVLNVLFAPVVALVGAATGFYFGANSQNQQGGR